MIEGARWRVGMVMDNYHPHGDSSIYEAPLIEMQGNNGSIDGDPNYIETIF